MKLSRIRIEQFRRFRQPLEINDLASGINLFTGPNEAGKSTVVAAIRAAFFERHRSGSVEGLRPWGDSTASPRVELEFSIGNQTCRLTKSFLGQRRCELQVGARRLDGAEAEDQLAELLGFRYAGRGASAAEHWGIPGLLWMQQGGAQELRDAVAHATDHLRSALDESLGEVVSSAGDEVVATVEAQRNELLTSATGKPRGRYADALRHETSLGDAVRACDGEIAAYRQQVDALAALRREHAADEADEPWVRFRSQQQAATDRLEAVRRMEETLAVERQHETRIAQQINLLHDQLETCASQEQAVATRTAALESARVAQAAAAARVEQWTAARAAAVAACDDARTTLRRARGYATRSDLARQLDDIRVAVHNTSVAVNAAQAQQKALLDLQRLAAACELAPTDLAALRKQHQEIHDLRIRQSAAATRLGFTLDDGNGIRIGDELLVGIGERLLLEATTIVLPGIGMLEIAPGGADLALLRSAAARLDDQHAALLQRLGVASLHDAETRHDTHEQRLADIRTAGAMLQALAPHGVDVLHTELAARQARAAEIERALRQLPPAAEDGDERPSVAAAEAAEEAAAKSLAAIDDSLHRAQRDAGSAQAAFEAATRELAAAQNVLAAPDRPERVATAKRELTGARAERSTLAARIEALGKQLAEARPDILRQDVERFRASAEQHQKRFNERRDALLRLEVELQAAGARGLEERRAELARDLAQAQRHAAQLRRRAHGLDHLLNLLRAKRRALTRRLQAPLQKHLNRYLQLLFPLASLEIDEDLTPGPLTRTGADGTESGEFDDLSFGAREQMGVISRLAYADLLREAGRPTLIILDDALVHSDAERLAQMKRVLFDAATRHQILLFTCHPENWRDLGVSARSLETLRAAA